MRVPNTPSTPTTSAARLRALVGIAEGIGRDGAEHVLLEVVTLRRGNNVRQLRAFLADQRRRLGQVVLLPLEGSADRTLRRVLQKAVWSAFDSHLITLVSEISKGSVSGQYLVGRQGRRFIR